MASRILSNFSSAAKSKLIKSKFSKEPSRAVSVLKEQHNYSTNKCDNQLKQLVVSRFHKGSHLTSLLSIGDHDNFANFTRQHRADSIFPVASCNNKILLNGLDDCGRSALWNPTTGEIQTLPRFGPRVEFDYTVYGLGFDPKTEGDYMKVIRVVKVSPETDFEVELYSQKTDSMEVFESPFESPPEHVFPSHGPSLFINGSYYWPALCSREYPNFDESNVILRFDFANEELSADIFLPDDDISNFILAEFEGSLAVVASRPNFGLEIWVWNQELNSWARRREYEWATVNSEVERLLGLFNDDQLYLQDFEGELVLFDCGTGELKNLGLKSYPPGDSGAMELFAYVQSSEEEVKYRENERKMKRYVGTLMNSNTSTFKFARINISDDSKQKPNNNNNNNKQKLLFFHDLEDNNSSNVLFNFPTLGAQFMIPTASCNSPLLLCCSDSDCGAAALWNPTTNEVKKLPDLQLSSPYRVFDSVWYGFGFDPKADEGDYKVIRFTPVTKENMNILNVRTELYSLKADSWKDLVSPYLYDEDLYAQPSLYINGFCYWVATRRDATGHGTCIVSFDFANEKFSSAPHIPLPNYEYEEIFLLTQFHGSLAALVYARTDDDDDDDDEVCSLFEPDQNTKPLEILELWVWNKDGESSWTKESVIHVPVGFEKPLGLFGNDQLYLQGSNGEILIFDCAKGGELKSLCPSLRSTINIFPYVESSFPLKNGEKIIRASHKIIDD